MSLQGLISGSECAVPFNPLSQVLKHTDGDRSLQQDRVASSSSARLHHLPGTSTAPAEQELALARQFFDGSARASGSGSAYAMPHYMPPPQLLRGLEVTTHAGPALSGAWDEMTFKQSLQSQAPRGEPGLSASQWTNEFANASAASTLGPSMQQNVLQRPNFQSSYSNFGSYGGGMGMYGSGVNMMPGMIQGSDKGKGKSRDIDFEQAFVQASVLLSTNQTESARIVDVDVDDVTATLSETKLESEQDTEAEPGFQYVWDSLQRSTIPPPPEDMAKWEAEFNQLMTAQRDDDNYDYGAMMQSAYEEGLSDYGITEGQNVNFDENGMPILDEYIFEKDNKYLDPSASTRSHLTEAKALLEDNGALSDVALLLEAAIQQGELGEGGYEAWILLGEARSMDEREDAAMRALTEGVKRAEQAGAAGQGMLSLAVSFTNESYERASHTMLLRWLSARFPSQDVSEDVWKALSQSPWHSHERVTEVFLNLARDQYSRGEMDPEVQIGLGVLFYTNNNFDRAKDCFETALSVRPRDYQLWNRLGSSLSNGNNPEAALGAYREALQLRPTYTRAIYNVGVACLNIGAHKEAAEHFLSALAMQDSSGGAKSDQLWSTLQRAFMLMDRPDLADQAKATANMEIFRKEGFDF
ncbi:peroxisome targeting signal receptor [Amylocystis lapponica]|nr:peroxisome targeting signal receptor [Amylocystis lapponica]